MKCPHGVDGCICTGPGASPHAHGQPPKPCDVCGGETGLHKWSCPAIDTRIVGYDLGKLPELTAEQRKELGFVDDDEGEAFATASDGEAKR